MKKILLLWILTIFVVSNALSQGNGLKFDHLDNISALANCSDTAIA